MALCLLLTRWPWIVADAIWSHDEAQFAANALIGARHFLSWHNNDCGSSGPLTCQLPAVLAWTGAGITLPGLRVLAVLLIVATAFYLYRTLCLLLGNRLYSLFITLPFVFFYALVDHQDFQHYSSELLPNLLLAAAIYYIFSWQNGLGLWRAALAALLLGLVPYSKLQAVLLAVALGAYLLLWLALTARGAARWKRLAVIVLCASLPGGIYLLPLVFTGQFHHFWNSYIQMAIDYKQETTSVPVLLAALHEQKVLLLYLLIMAAMALMGLVSGGYNVLARSRLATTRFALCLLLFALSIYTVLSPGMMFPHYLNFLLPFSVLLAAHCWPSVVAEKTLGGPSRRAVGIGLLLLLAGMLYYSRSSSYPAANSGPSLDSFKATRLLDGLLPDAPTSLLVWGWAPDLYVRSGLLPASRYTTSSIHLGSYPLRDYFNARLQEDFARARPELVLDKVSVVSTPYNDLARDGVTGPLSPIRDIVRQGYTRLTAAPRSGMESTLYVRNDVWQNIQAKNIFFTRVAASDESGLGPDDLPLSVHATDDYRVEDTEANHDWWGLPLEQTGWIRYEWPEPETIDRIHILNSGGGAWKGQGVDRLDAVLLDADGQEILRLPLTLAPYPFWTFVQIPPELLAGRKARALRLDIHSYRGLRAALNEVKVFRP